MIDIENEVFDIVATSLREALPEIFVRGEYVRSPPKFPCVSIVEASNIAYVKTQSSDMTENHAELMIEVNIYSNKTSGKKSECRNIASLVDAEMTKLGFTRSMLQPVPDADDVTIYRMAGRYTAVVLQNKTIYRR